MPLAKLTAKRFALSEIRPIVDSIARFVVTACSPDSIYLVGSAARDEFTSYSDLDFVIVLPDQQAIRQARAVLHAERPHKTTPVDFILIDRERFRHESDLGGMAFEAKHHGIALYTRATE